MAAHQLEDDGGPGQAGRDEMDGEHHVQLGLLYALREAVQAGQGENVRDVLDRLIEYSKMHFAAEQLLMRMYQYGDYDGHLGEHEQMIQSLEMLRADQAAVDGVVREQALDALDTGLLGHIRGADSALGRYLAGLPRHPERIALNDRFRRAGAKECWPIRDFFRHHDGTERKNGGALNALPGWRSGDE